LIIDVKNGNVKCAWRRNEVIKTVNKLVMKARSRQILVI
jgi:hypothetical protein